MAPQLAASQRLRIEGLVRQHRLHQREYPLIEDLDFVAYDDPGPRVTALLVARRNDPRRRVRRAGGRSRRGEGVPQPVLDLRLGQNGVVRGRRQEAAAKRPPGAQSCVPADRPPRSCSSAFAAGVSRPVQRRPSRDTDPLRTVCGTFGSRAPRSSPPGAFSLDGRPAALRVLAGRRGSKRATSAVRIRSSCISRRRSCAT
jgi:hypothetical protein